MVLSSVLHQGSYSYRYIFVYELANKNTKFPVVIITTPMFQLLKAHYQWVKTVTGTCTYMHTCNTSAYIQCKVMYEDSVVRVVNCLLSKVQMFKVYTNLYSLAKSMMTLFLWLYKFTGCPLDVFVFTDTGLKNCYMYVYAYFVCGMV
jgi:hypothetical protein